VRIFLFLWIAGIFYLSVNSGPQSETVGNLSLSSAFYHFLAFFVLFPLFYFSFPRKTGKTFNYLVLSFALTAGVSLSKECAQLYFPLRVFGLDDMVIDLISALLGGGIILGFVRLEKIRHRTVSPAP
jgi:VanZ family protein